MQSEDRLVNLGFTATNSWLASHNTSWFVYVLKRRRWRIPEKIIFAPQKLLFEPRTWKKTCTFRKVSWQTVWQPKAKKNWTPITVTQQCRSGGEISGEVQGKLKNLHCAKFKLIEFTNFRKETKRTGGGLSCFETCSEFFICKIFQLI